MSDQNAFQGAGGRHRLGADYPSDESQSAAPGELHKRHVSTEVAAKMLMVQTRTLHRQHSVNGSYGSIRPIRLKPSRRLAWPLDEIQALLSGEAK